MIYLLYLGLSLRIYYRFDRTASSGKVEDLWYVELFGRRIILVDALVVKQSTETERSFREVVRRLIVDSGVEQYLRCITKIIYIFETKKFDT